MAEFVGGIYSTFELDARKYDSTLAESGRKTIKHGQIVSQTASQATKSFERIRRSVQAPAGSLDALNKKLETLRLRLARTEGGTAAFNRLATRAAHAQNAVDALNRSQARTAAATRGGGGFGPLASIFPALGSGAALAASGIAAAGAAVAAGTVAVFKLGGELQQTRVAFTTLTGSAEKANRVINQLVSDSNTSPFTAEQYLRAGKTLTAFGESAENLSPVLRRIGDLAAGTGKDFNELATIYGKARVQGRLMGEDVNQILEAGIPLIQELAKQFGISEGAVKKLVSTGAVSFSNLERAFIDLTAEGSKFGGMMDAQSRTLPGKISTIVGNLQNLAAKVGEMAAPALSPALDAITDLLMKGQDVIDWFKQLDRGTLDAAASVAKFIVVMNPLVLPFWALHKAVSAVWALIQEGARRVGPWLALLREEAARVAATFRPLGTLLQKIGSWVSGMFSGAGDRLAEFGESAVNVFFKGLILPIRFAIKLIRAFGVGVEGAIELFHDLAFAAAGFVDLLKVIGTTEFGKLPDPAKLKAAWGQLKLGIKEAGKTGAETGRRIKEALSIEFETKEVTENLKKALDKAKIPPFKAVIPGPKVKPPKAEIIGFITAWQRAFDKQALAGLKTSATLEQRQARMIKQFVVNAAEFSQAVSAVANQITSLVTASANLEVTAMERTAEKRGWLLDAWGMLAQRQYDRDMAAFTEAEDAKLEAARRTHDARLALIDEEFARKKAELEAEKERVLAEDEESRLRKEEEIIFGTASRKLELEQIGVLNEEALATQRMREEEYADKLAKLREETDAKKSEQDAATAETEKVLQADREKREEEARARREQSERNHARTVALFEWQAESAALSVKGQADARAAIIGGITGAAQAFSAIVAAFSMLGPVGFAIGIGVATGVAGLITLNAFRAAAQAQSQTVLPPLAAFASGGVLRENSGAAGRDSVPAILMPGESVIDRTRTRAMQTFIDRMDGPMSRPATIHVGTVNFNIAANDSPTQIEDINRGFDRLVEARRGRAFSFR